MTVSLTKQPTTAADLVDQMVWAWNHDTPILYKGDDDRRSGFESFIYGANGVSIVTSFDRIAPASLVLPVRDIRVVVSKGNLRLARQMGHYGRGAWMLDLPGRRVTFHDTKREAMAAGLRRCAILDWHASLS